MRLAEAMKAVSNLPFGGTDCALPMLYALERGLEIDAFVVYTDNETWAGEIHPAQALQMYRERTRHSGSLGGGGHGIQRLQHRRPERRRHAGRSGHVHG